MPLAPVPSYAGNRAKLQARRDRFRSEGGGQKKHDFVSAIYSARGCFPDLKSNIQVSVFGDHPFAPNHRWRKAGPCAKRPGGLFGLEDLHNKSFGLTSELCVVDVTAEPGMGKLRTGPKCPICAKACDFIRRTQRRLSTGYHDPLAKLCEKTPRTYRSRYLNDDDPAFIGSIR